MKRILSILFQIVTYKSSITKVLLLRIERSSSTEMYIKCPQMNLNVTRKVAACLKLKRGGGGGGGEERENLLGRERKRKFCEKDQSKETPNTTNPD